MQRGQRWECPGLELGLEFEVGGEVLGVRVLRVREDAVILLTRPPSSIVWSINEFVKCGGVTTLADYLKIFGAFAADSLVSAMMKDELVWVGWDTADSALAFGLEIVLSSELLKMTGCKILIVGLTAHVETLTSRTTVDYIGVTSEPRDYGQGDEDDRQEKEDNICV